MGDPTTTASLRGFKDAKSYDQHRPSYPIETIESLLEHLQVRNLRGARIVEIGAGTGKFTELLAKRDEDYEIIAVEPHEEMRCELQRKKLKNVIILGAEAKSMTVESQCADAVIASQSFHWFANTEALTEIYRVLSPGGVLGMIWNIEDYNAPKSWTPTTEWEGRLKDLTWSAGNNNTRFRHNQWRQVFEKQLQSTPFSIQAADPLFSLPLGEDCVEWTCWLSHEAIWERYHTLTQIAGLEGDELSDTREKVLEIVAQSDAEKDKGGNRALHGHTFSAWTSAIPGAR